MELMEQEIEAKFLNIDLDETRAKLKDMGAELLHEMQLVRRTVMDFPDRRLKKQGAWIRVREEVDDSIEMMLKKVASDELGQTFEQPVKVSDYDAAIKFLLSLGFEVKNEEESKRELWRLGDLEIMLDVWPWVNPFIEIEGPTEAGVKGLASKLGFEWVNAKFGNVIPVYTDKYGISDASFKAAEMTIKFDLPVPDILVNSSVK